jgi:N-acetyl-anhydromuramyl-L-alanine amidase AmpD
MSRRTFPGYRRQPRTALPARHTARGAASAAALLLALSGCGSDRVLEPCPTVAATVVGAGAAPLPPSEWDAAFARAGAARGVDPALLHAVAWVETRGQEVEPEHADDALDHHGRPPAWGVMALRGGALERAAALAGLEPGRVRRDAAAGIDAAAALLADYARSAGVAHLPAEQWGPALELYFGLDGAEGRRAYVHDAVLPALARARAAGAAMAGAAGAGRAAAAECKPVAPPPPPPPPPPAGTVTTVWRASPNFNARAAGIAGQVSMIIVHTCEGAYVGCWSWLTNTASGVSAHYVVDEEGTQISQLVHEQDRAWHIGATYACTLNHGRRCDLEGVQSNHFTVGIEHAGYARQTSFPSTQTDVSARLACTISRAHGVPRDPQHIVGHGQLQPYNRTDPGPNWPWTRYLAAVQRHCGELVADDEPALNDALHTRASVPATWTAASATAGYYGSGYRWAATAPDATDALAFEFLVSTAGTHTIEARWPAGTNRSAAARYTLRTEAGVELATADVDQRVHHDTWRVLATADLAPGWYRVELSRRGPAGSVVVADAVRARR